MREMQKVNSGNYSSMKKLYNAYDVCDGQFGCKLKSLAIKRKSKIFDKWQVSVSYTYENSLKLSKFDNEVSMAYDFLWDRPHAVLYFLRK